MKISDLINFEDILCNQQNGLFESQTNKIIAYKAPHLGLALPGKTFSNTAPTDAHFAPLPRLMLKEQR